MEISQSSEAIDYTQVAEQLLQRSGVMRFTFGKLRNDRVEAMAKFLASGNARKYTRKRLDGCTWEYLEAMRHLHEHREFWKY